MQDDTFALIVEGLDKVDALELEEDTAGSDFVAATLGDDDQRLGEPGTIILIAAVGAVALPPVLVWLARHKRWFRFSDTQETTLPDGTRVRRVVKLSIGAASPPSASELEKLGDMTGTSAADLAKLLSLSRDP